MRVLFHIRGSIFCKLYFSRKFFHNFYDVSTFLEILYKNILIYDLICPPPCCYHKGQIVNSTMFDKGRLTLILFFQLNLSYINKPFRKMPKNSNFLIRLETGCTDCLLQVYTKENKRKVTWYGQQNLSLVNTIE